jgi:hypothetical protein
MFGDRPIAYRFSTAFSVLTVLIVIAALVSGLLDHQTAVRNDYRGTFHHRTASADANSKAGTNAGTDAAANNPKAPSQTAVSAPPPAADVYSEIAHALAPFAYGAMGACVFLLRSLHKHIWGRTFDRRRKPEYYSRVMLGAISGGAIVLLLTSDVGSPEGAVKLGYNALGFLAGYNTDLLFSTIERIMNAIFPKTAGPATPKILPALPQPVSKPPSGGDGHAAGAGDASDKAAAATTDMPPGSISPAPSVQAEPPEGDKATSDVPNPNTDSGQASPSGSQTG